MTFIVLFIGLIIYGIWKNCEPQIPASYHNNWKLEQEDSWKVSTGEMSKRQFMKNIPVSYTHLAVYKRQDTH